MLPGCVNFDLRDVLRFHLFYKEDPRAKQWLLDLCSQSENKFFTVASSSVCSRCFCALYGFSYSTLKRTKRKATMGQVNIGPPVAGRLNATQPRLQKMMAWLRLHGGFYGDYMPHEMVIEVPEYTVKELYFTYTASMSLAGEQPVCIGTLYKAMRRDDCGMRLRLRRTFKTCTECDRINNAIKSTCEPSLRNALGEEKAAHIKFQSEERMVYAEHKMMAVQYPDRILVIVMDDMDQAKTNLPQSDRPTTEKQDCPKLRVHVTGIRVHGEPQYTKLFTWYDHFPSDANVPIEVLLRTLSTIKADRGELPPTLYLQLDNCRVNKNRWVITLLAVLVEADIFERVSMNFLLVGHTHCDIDQVFSVIARALRNTSTVSTLDDLHGVITSSRQGQNAFHVEHLLDICDWKPWLNSVMVKMRNHSVPRSFLVRKLNGETRLWVAATMQHATDTYEPEGGLSVLRPNLQLSQIAPPSLLRLVPRRALSLALPKQGNLQESRWLCRFLSMS